MGLLRFHSYPLIMISHFNSFNSIDKFHKFIRLNNRSYHFSPIKSYSYLTYDICILSFNKNIITGLYFKISLFNYSSASTKTLSVKISVVSIEFFLSLEYEFIRFLYNIPSYIGL
jgi:hypothetical protein